MAKVLTLSCKWIFSCWNKLQLIFKNKNAKWVVEQMEQYSRNILAKKVWFKIMFWKNQNWNSSGKNDIQGLKSTLFKKVKNNAIYFPVASANYTFFGFTQISLKGWFLSKERNILNRDCLIVFKLFLKISKTFVVRPALVHFKTFSTSGHIVSYVRQFWQACFFYFANNWTLSIYSSYMLWYIYY